MASVDQFAADFRAQYPNIESITAMFADLNGVMRGKVLPASSFDKLMGDGILLPASVFGTDATGESVPETGLVWETGDADFPWQAITETLHILPGSEGKNAAVMIQMMDHDNTPHQIDPRGALMRVIDRLNAQGLFPVIAPELEFYLINPKLDTAGMGQIAATALTGKPQPMGQVYGLDSYDEFAPVIDHIKSACADIAVGADAAISEYGKSQFEINLMHRDDPIRAADEAIMLKRITRIVARHHGHDVTFMGKPFSDDTGSGFHLHASLLDADGHNVMAEAKGASPDSHENLRHAAAGMGRYLDQSMAVFAPNANAWRRIQPGHYAPIDRSWGHNNRTVSFRIPHGDAKARRLEHRCASADANPYLSIALILAAMAEGMEQKLTPPPITMGNAYDQPDREGLPNSWGEANARFAGSDFAKKWLGEDMVRVYAATKEYERLQFESLVTPTEWTWYR